MEMHQVRYFLAVAKELNFTRAAERCNVAQPSLTRAIKLLEEELGGPLFHRERARTHLSELGNVVLPYLTQVYEQTQTVKQQAHDFSRLRHTALKLGVMCTVSPVHLIDLVRALQSRHQGIELQLFDASAPALEQRLIAGDLEICIYCLPGRERDERLHYLPLFREQYMIVVHHGHPLASRNAIRVKDLDGERYLNRVNCELNGCPVFSRGGVTCEMVYRSERDDWILAMVAAGLGFGLMPEYSVNHNGVVARPLVEPEFWREVSLVTVRGRPHSPAVGAFVREAMRTQWLGQPALAVRKETERETADEGADTVD
jgi:LysR family transcriptional regulator, hydrogen peroxide-inducible genes activator